MAPNGTPVNYEYAADSALEESMFGNEEDMMRCHAYMNNESCEADPACEWWDMMDGPMEGDCGCDMTESCDDMCDCDPDCCGCDTTDACDPGCEQCDMDCMMTGMCDPTFVEFDRVSNASIVGGVVQRNELKE